MVSYKTLERVTGSTLHGSLEPVLSGGDGRTGEDSGVSGRLQGHRGSRGRELARAAHVSVVQLPQELLVLHGETLVHVGLLLKRLLQHGLLRGQLPDGGGMETALITG